MKWKNKGKEFDEIWKEMKISSDEEICFYLFGAGKRGTELCSLFRLMGLLQNVKAFLDNDKALINTVKDGLSVQELSGYIPRKNSIVIISVGEKYEKEISEQLDEFGLKKNVDYFLWNDFYNYYFPLILLYKYNILFDDMVQISLTERCTLRCKNCAHTCPYTDKNNKLDLTIDEAMNSIDSFFGTFDYVNRFTLLGGEPLLYKNICEVTQYLGEKYRSRINDCFITTNATIIPNEQLLNICKNYNIGFEISDYRVAVPAIRNRVNEFIECLEKETIKYRVLNDDWIDLGFLYINNTNKEAERIFDLCKAPCHEVRLNRYYTCILARCASENIYANEGNEYYIEIGSKDEVTRKIAFEFIQGYCQEGYLKMCKHCNGLFSKNNKVTPGEQLLL